MAKQNEVQGYCAKCRKSQTMNEGYVEVVSSRGMTMAKGNCSVCNTKVCRILGKAK